MTRTLRDIVKVETQALPVEAFSFLRELFVGDRKAINAFELATQVLSDFADDKLAKARGANESLRAAILEHYPRFLATLPTEDDGFYGLRDGILEIDARFADYIEKNFGGYGTSTANSIRASEETIQVAADSFAVRDWARKWREFSQTDSGKEISEKTESHAKTIIDAYWQNSGEVDIESDPSGFIDWIKSSFAESIKNDLLHLFEEQVRFMGPLDGLRTDLFCLWLGGGGSGGRFATITSKRNCQFASVVWLHIVRPEIEREGRSLFRVSTPATMALSKRNVATQANIIAVEAEVGFQLSLETAGAAPGSLAQFLTDEAFHTYMIAQMLFSENGMPANGEFLLESGYATILSAKGYQLQEREKKVGGKIRTVREHRSQNLATIKRHIEDLGKIYPTRVGHYTTSKRMPLVYDVKNSANKELSLRHNPLVVEHLRSEIGIDEDKKTKRNFVQVPRTLIEQPNARAVRHGYAFIQAVRDGSYHSALSHEQITIRFRKAAELVGATNSTKQSDKAFYTGIAERYIEAAGVGDLGKVEVDFSNEKLILLPEPYILEPYIENIKKPRNRRK